MSEQSFKNFIDSRSSICDFWGCFDRENGELIAYAINNCRQYTCEYESLKAKPKYLKGYYPFYGLIYEMNKYYLGDMGYKYVNDGARSITGHSNIQPFLMEKFKFRKTYTSMRIKYVWWFRFIINMLYPFRKVIHIRKIHTKFRGNK